MWTYQARLSRVIDGDTVEVVIDLGLYVSITERVRLAGVDTPEVHGPSREAGLAATAFTRQWLSDAGAPLATAWPLTISTTKAASTEKFGRFLATITRAGDPVSLNDALIAAGHAVPYDGGRRGDPVG